MIDIGSRVKIESSGLIGFVVDIRPKTRTCTIECKTSDGDYVFNDCSFDDIQLV